MKVIPIRPPWMLSRHALTRCEEMALSHADVQQVIIDHEVAYESSKPEPGRVVFVRGDIAVVTNPAQRRVITVLLHRQEDWDRAKDEVRHG